MMNSIIERIGYDPQGDADNGNRFLTGNGYLGVRGTVCEAGPGQMAAVNLSGIHHQKGQGWEEPLNAPNPFFFRAEGFDLTGDSPRVISHRLAVDIRCGLFIRETVFAAEGGSLTLRQERFCGMEQVHLLAQRITLTANHDMTLKALWGIDPHVWDIHGPHFDTLIPGGHNGVISLTGETDAGQRVCTALRGVSGEACGQAGLRQVTLSLVKDRPLILDTVAAVYTSSDCPDPTSAACAAALAAPGYDDLLTAQRRAWDALWQRAEVTIEGDAQAEQAINYSLYHLMCIGPRHREALSVPARGLSGQTYKGAIFWDTEMFMLDFYLSCMPEVARHCLSYRIGTLQGALEKAAAYGYQGAFYAWESVEGGKDACTDYNVTDVFTGRPMRTYFRDTQIHISAAVVYGIRKYVAHTGDDSLLREGGAEVVRECARFYLSRMTRGLLSQVYDLTDVIGPDEYHEHVNNNAYTNEMARMTLRYACEICPRYLPGTEPELLAAFADAADRLKRQQPDPETGVIPQFDGYMQLEDVRVGDVRARLLNPREYWGGAYGVASQTQVIKQADVIAMLYMLDEHPSEVIAANYDFYEPRTEHGSSLSACMYSLCACRIGRPDDAYPLFMKSAMADINGGGKQWAGLVYIGGTHPAAAGGAYMVLLYGFLGLHFHQGRPVLSPRLPKGWKRVRLPLHWQGRDWTLDTAE